MYDHFWCGKSPHLTYTLDRQWSMDEVAMPTWFSTVSSMTTWPQQHHPVYFYMLIKHGTGREKTAKWVIEDSICIPVQVRPHEMKPNQTVVQDSRCEMRRDGISDNTNKWPWALRQSSDAVVGLCSSSISSPCPTGSHSHGDTIKTLAHFFIFLFSCHALPQVQVSTPLHIQFSIPKFQFITGASYILS